MIGFKEKCVSLRKAGCTLPEIVKITRRPKSSIYFHIAGISLNQEKRDMIRVASTKRARELALARKGKSERDFRKFKTWSSETVSLVSHLMFDGSITNSSCIYNNRNISLLNSVEKHMKYIYDFEPKRWLNQETGVNRISYHNVALAKYLKDKSEALLSEIGYLQKNLKREFVRAFFDDEGCVDFRPKRSLRQIRGYQKNISILILIQHILSEFGIKSRVVKPNEIVISRKENLLKFQEGINFSEGVKLNENRINSTWKKPLEKRGLLDQAIKSFKI